MKKSRKRRVRRSSHSRRPARRRRRRVALVMADKRRIFRRRSSGGGGILGMLIPRDLAGMGFAGAGGFLQPAAYGLVKKFTRTTNPDGSAGETLMGPVLNNIAAAALVFIAGNFLLRSDDAGKGACGAAAAAIGKSLGLYDKLGIGDYVNDHDDYLADFIGAGSGDRRSVQVPVGNGRFMSLPAAVGRERVGLHDAMPSYSYANASPAFRDHE